MEWKDLENVNKDIRTIGIHDKNYALIASRVQAFRKLYPEGSIKTELVSNDNGVCVFKATVGYSDTVLATGYAFEKADSSMINKTSYIENCETSAVGRALGFLGIGIDGSICSAEELQQAEANQKEDDTPAFLKTKETAAKKYKPKWLEQDQISKEVWDMMQSRGMELTKVRAWAVNNKLTYRNIDDEIALKAIELYDQEKESL